MLASFFVLNLYFRLCIKDVRNQFFVGPCNTLFIKLILLCTRRHFTRNYWVLNFITIKQATFLVRKRIWFICKKKNSKIKVILFSFYILQFIIEDHLGYTIEKLESEANKLDVNGKLLKALLLVNLLADLKIEAMYLQPKCREIISHSFLIFPEIEWNNCPQLDFLNNCMDQSMRK